ncbi:hypothetical protein [Lysinibacillus sp. FSL K6-3209]|nr:hypothetical protein T479_22450 [Lysinibacillus varians]
MKKWICPKIKALSVKKFDNRMSSIESSLYASNSSGHHGELTRN